MSETRPRREARPIPDFQFQPRYEFSFLFGAGAFVLIGVTTVGLGVAVLALTGSLGAGIGALIAVFAVFVFIIARRLEKVRATRGAKLQPIALRAGKLRIPNKKENDELIIDVTQPFVMETAWEYTPASHASSSPSSPSTRPASYQTMLVLEQDGKRAQLYSHEVVFKKTLQKIEYLAPGEVPPADWVHQRDYVAMRNAKLKDIVDLFRLLRRCPGVQLHVRTRMDDADQPTV